LRPNSLAWRKIVRVFGKKILSKTNEIDRKLLGNEAFSNKHSLSKLNEITHPRIEEEIKKEFDSLKRKKKKIVILDAPLLIEADLLPMVDFLVVVKADLEKRLERVCTRDFFCREEAIKRINTQIPIKEKVKLADFIIDNNGSIEKTEEQVEKLAKKIEKLVKK
jgi:dephospho-CoA kinase